MVKPNKVFLILIISLLSGVASGQQMPFNPISYRIFNPFLLNPAAAGSKDFLSTDIIAGFNGKSYSQIISANSRIAKPGQRYFQAESPKTFTGLGIGAAAFNDFNSIDSTNSAGGVVALAYHYPVSNNGLTFVSAGISAKECTTISMAIRSSELLRRSFTFRISMPGYMSTDQPSLPEYRVQTCSERRRIHQQ